MKEYIRASLLIGLLLCCPMSLPAGELPDFGPLGLKIISTTNFGDGRTQASLTDQAGRPCLISWDIAPDALVLRKISELRAIVQGWEGLEIRTLSLIVSGQMVEALIIPEKLVIAGTEIAHSIPAGLGLYYQDYIQFDFRMVKDSISMRIAGRFIDRAGLAQLMQRALANPLSFADKTNYMARLDRLDRALGELRARNAKLERELQLVRHASLRLFNTGFFCGPAEIPEVAVKRVLALRLGNPKITADEMRKTLRQEGIKLSGSEIGLILALYFNEWDD